MTEKWFLHFFKILSINSPNALLVLDHFHKVKTSHSLLCFKYRLIIFEKEQILMFTDLMKLFRRFN